MLMKYLKSILPFICLLQLLPAQQDLDKKIEYRSDELNKIRKEIREYQQELRTVESEEKSLLTRLHETEKKISLTEKLITQLQRERQQKERQIRETEQSISTLEMKLKALKAEFAARLVYVYKKGDYNDLELLLTSQSLNQAIYRHKYLRILADIEKQLAFDIKHNISEVDRKKQQRLKELEEKRQIIDEQIKYQRSLAQQNKKRNQQIAAAKRNKNYLATQIKEKQAAAKQLSQLIANLEEEKAAREKELARQRALSGIRGKNLFPKNKGHLNWPVSGEIVSKFGTHKHPTLKTITENSGIDIKASRGTPVRVVFDGVITTITYIRGFGNTIIVDHGSGYYTVYTHVNNVRVYENQYVSTRTVLAEVGDSGSLSGTLLHFEIWNKRNKLNPEEWLTRAS